jgi:pseudaminic acid biosynthesis-associated methylase
VSDSVDESYKVARYRTEQERFWAGEFGTEYIGRNQNASIVAANLALFAQALRGARGIESCLEFGANIGLNLRALRQLLPHASLGGIEINEEACSALRCWLDASGGGQAHHASILEFCPPSAVDLVLVKGVLIHISPDELPLLYEKLVQASKRYVLVAEYYNPTPLAVPYRGHGERLFKRDFVGEMMDRHRDLRLIDYGFVYHRDPLFPQDDLTWFLLEK